MYVFVPSAKSCVSFFFLLLDVYSDNLPCEKHKSHIYLEK